MVLFGGVYGGGGGCTCVVVEDVGQCCVSGRLVVVIGGEFPAGGAHQVMRGVAAGVDRLDKVRSRQLSQQRLGSRVVSTGERGGCVDVALVPGCRLISRNALAVAGVRCRYDHDSTVRTVPCGSSAVSSTSNVAAGSWPPVLRSSPAAGRPRRVGDRSGGR